MSATKHDFDFLLGRWQVENHKLKDRLAGGEGWDAFAATLAVKPILNGLGNVDEFAILDSDFKGTTLRLFNPETKLWSLILDGQPASLPVSAPGWQFFKWYRGIFF